MKKTYYPTTDAEQGIWWKNFGVKIALHGASLGISAAEISQIQADSLVLNYLNETIDSLKKELAKRIAYRNALTDNELGSTLGVIPAAPVFTVAPTAVPAGINKSRAKFVARIKNHSNYTNAIGEDLGIIGSETAAKIASDMPVLKATVNGGRVVLKWKKGKYKSIDLYVDRGDNKGFVLLTTATTTTYTDKYELPTGVNALLCIYKARYKKGDEPCGDFSAEVRETISRQLNK